jgi:hypothetical protein
MTDLYPFAVSIAEAVKMTGLGRTSIFAAIKRRELLARKSGRRTILETEELRRFIGSLPKSDAAQNAT